MIRTLGRKLRITRAFGRFKTSAEVEQNPELQKIFEEGLEEWTRAYFTNREQYFSL